MEHIIREDFTIEALEIIELYCELLLARFGLLEQLKYVGHSLGRVEQVIIRERIH